MCLRIRVSGTADGVAAVLPVLDAVLDVVETSDFYPNRAASKWGRVYLDATGPRAGTVPATATWTDTEQSAPEQSALEQWRGGDPA